jgi:hypothetical protein
MRSCSFLVPVLLACSALPLRATLIAYEQFSSPSMPAGWTAIKDANYNIGFPGDPNGLAVFSRSPLAGDGFARLS